MRFLSEQPKKEYVDTLLEQREKFYESRERKKAEAKARMATEQAQRRQERSAARKQLKAEREACALWASANLAKIHDAIDGANDALESIGGFAMIGEGDPSITAAMIDAYDYLVERFGDNKECKIGGQRVAWDMTSDERSELEERLDKDIAELLSKAYTLRTQLCEADYHAIDRARNELSMMSDFMKKLSIGIYEPP